MVDRSAGVSQQGAVGRFAALEAIQDRILWLSMLMIHHANRVRPNPSGLKVGGHQASSASVVSLMTSLFFDFMRPGDRISVKPHAAPVLHAVHYLLGNLDRRYLTTLRAFHGLQAYPSRTKDPFPVDFSTGSVGLGAVAPNFAALASRYVHAHFGCPEETGHRFISLIGDAELDEGSIWEAVAEPALTQLDDVIWVVDLNRQSLDRVVPGLRVRQLEAMFQANGWKVIEAKYGRQLTEAFRRPGGDALRRRIDEMSNEEYQYLLRAGVSVVRRELGEDLLADRSDGAVRRLLGDLGGHDLQVLHDALADADAVRGPSVIFAYTIKGWRLPIAGDPLNHSALLTSEQMDTLRNQLGIPADDVWATFPADSEESRVCRETGLTVDAAARRPHSVEDVPDDLGREYGDVTSTQGAFGQILTTLLRVSPGVARRVVTVSPDVAISTNLGGWINRVGVWHPTDDQDPFTVLGPRLIQWNRKPQGQHIELGISETNLLMALGQLGLAGERTGEPLLAIGTLYDPFVARALDAFVYGIYSGSRFVLVGTPSGVTLAPEGGAHQSIVTPLVGEGLPGVLYHEPCFALELEWLLLDALRALYSADGGRATYFRLSTAVVDQTLLPGTDREQLRKKVLSGAYRLVDRAADPGCQPGRNTVEIWATGVMVPGAVRASEELLQDGIYANVVNCVSPGLVYRTWQDATHESLKHLRPAPVQMPVSGPVVTVIDAHPAALAWVGSMLGRKAYPLGVVRFGESGLPADLYQACKIDWESIYAACCVALKEAQ